MVYMEQESLGLFMLMGQIDWSFITTHSGLKSKKVQFREAAMFTWIMVKKSIISFEKKIKRSDSKETRRPKSFDAKKEFKNYLFFKPFEVISILHFFIHF